LTKSLKDFPDYSISSVNPYRRIQQDWTASTYRSQVNHTLQSEMLVFNQIAHLFGLKFATLIPNAKGHQYGLFFQQTANNLQQTRPLFFLA
jgi:hypothetical protein